LTAILENTSDLVAIARPDGRLTYINEAGRRMLGYDMAEDVGRYSLNEAHPAWALRIVLEEGLPGARMHGIWQGETAVLNRDGREIPVSQVILANRKANGEIDFFSTIIRDMSERKQAEAALLASEEKYRLLTEGMKDVVWTMDPQTMRYLYVSPSVTALRGFTPEEIMAAPAEEAFVPSARENLKEFIRQHTADFLAGKEKPGQFYTNVLEQTCKDGSTVWTEVISRFYRNKETGAVEIRGVARDITERKHLEEQLLQAWKMESIGRLAGGVAHDFNNLLTAILGNIELALLEKDVGPKASARLQVVQQAAASAAELTKQLLAFSRKQIIKPQVIDLNELIWNMGKMLARVIGEDVTLRSTSQPGLHPIKVDVGQMQQIIMNLAVNARDAMPEGGVLTIETANVVLDEAYCLRHGYGKSGAHIMLAVSDTGTGMNAEVKEHLFEPFFTTKALGKGTGLGLATVYGAVKQNNGYIDVYSEPGQGTCFKIYFPAVALEETSLTKGPGAEELSGGSETVLLVEDDPGVLEFARGTLELLGYHVLAASNAEDALALARDYDGAIALLMTDVKLPGMNGRQLADTLVHDRPGLRVLFNSGYTADTIVHHGVLEQDLHFIGKPFSAHALAHKLRQVLDGA